MIDLAFEGAGIPVTWPDQQCWADPTNKTAHQTFSCSRKGEPTLLGLCPEHWQEITGRESQLQAVS